MRYPVRILHAELSTRCQASCPQCPRNAQGGAVQPWVKPADIKLADFKTWFPEPWVNNLDLFFACGNYGDPAMAPECAEIFDYVLDNSGAQVRLHTNGSLRTPKWWRRLGERFGWRGEVLFGIDGLPGEHELYRRGTKWERIVRNAENVVAGGGRAVASCLVFKHNQDSLDELERRLMQDHGFFEVRFVPTGRFLGQERYSVRDQNDQHQYWLERTTIPQFRGPAHLGAARMAADIQMRQNWQKTVELAPKCLLDDELYLDAHGRIAPCCWMAEDLTEHVRAPVNPEFILRAAAIQHAKDLGLQMVQLTDRPVNEVFYTEEWEQMRTLWENEIKSLTCAWHCGKKK
jgi:MoaA/NifB/PqqE/SkfB family radical SAM enzyme